ncbi:MAG TPA: metallopeptidase family protein [Planctomycetota bacterium]|nr:metallopeptidase family protein [Planctomycetota bacterium]
MTLKRFKQIARKAVRELPEMFHPHVDEIAILVKRRPSRRMLRELEIPEDDDLFGLYEGPPLTERPLDSMEIPRVLLFYEPLLDACETEEELEREIRITVLHEIGHFFGLDEEQLEKLGYG